MTDQQWQAIADALKHAEGNVIDALKTTPQKHRALRARLHQIQRALTITRGEHLRSY